MKYAARMKEIRENVLQLLYRSSHIRKLFGQLLLITRDFFFSENRNYEIVQLHIRILMRRRVRFRNPCFSKTLSL